MAQSRTTIPWIEKYRPTNFNDIVLSEINRKLLGNIIQTGRIPNMLFYGPPGTGKTTTVVNFIEAYHRKQNVFSNELRLHLNASDERGIEVIRTQISQFVNSKPLFEKGTKFVILDEVDYMTKAAQIALKYLLQVYANDVRFFLICNYTSKLEESLRNEFVRLRFNQLPTEEIITFLRTLCLKENIKGDIQYLEYIKNTFDSDIRSMVNKIQLDNTHSLQLNRAYLDEDCFTKIIDVIKSPDIKRLDKVKYIKSTSVAHNISVYTLILSYFKYHIFVETDNVRPEMLDLGKRVIRSKMTEDMLAFYFVENVPFS